MLSDKDRAVVIEMCRTGMSLEVLKKSFPQFDSKDIEQQYYEQQTIAQKKTEDEVTISCNCS